MLRKLPCKEIAARLDQHLKRMEADPAINVLIMPGKESYRLFWNAGAIALGRYVGVTYIRYQGHRSLTRDQAAAYLAWLDAGNNGRHYTAIGRR
jgi:hypothetical protein